MDKATAAEVVDREADPLPRTSIAAMRIEPVPQRTTEENAEGQDATEEDVLRLRDTAWKDQDRQQDEPCASCGGPH